jgi:hypothetical protein
MTDKQLHPSGLNIIENPDGSFIFEWNKEDLRWSWLNDLTDQEIQVMIEELIQNPTSLGNILNDIQSMGSDE